jgi:hypothetical protein
MTESRRRCAQERDPPFCSEDTSRFTSSAEMWIAGPSSAMMIFLAARLGALPYAR